MKDPYACSCGHRAVEHEDTQGVVRPRRCTVPGCKCQKYEQPPLKWCATPDMGRRTKPGKR